MDRHAATRRLRILARSAAVTTARMHPHMLRHTFVTTMPASREAAPATGLPLPQIIDLTCLEPGLVACTL